MSMNRFEKGLCLVVACLCLGAGVYGSVTDSPDNPYGAITARNVFGLKDPPPPPAVPTNAPPAAPPNIKITGVSRLMNVKRAHFIVVDNATPIPGKQTPPPETNYVSLPEGAEKDNLRVVTIDEKGGSAKVMISGIERIMSLENDGLKIPTGMMQPLPGMAAVPPGGMPPGAIQPGMPPPNVPFTVPRGAAPNAATPMAGAGAATAMQTTAADITSQLQSIPSRRVRTTTDYAQPQSTLTGDQAAVLMQTYKAVNQDKIDQGLLPPLPPSPAWMGGGR